MYRYEVTSSVKSDIENVIGRPYFYEDDSKYYIDSPKHQVAIQYFHAPTDQIKSETLDQICQDLYSSDFSANSTQSEISSREEVEVKYHPPFAAKVTQDGKKLFRRVHGVTHTLSGDTQFNITVPYIQCKINKLEILWAPEGLCVDLEVFDSHNYIGSYQQFLGVPEGAFTANLKLNQFGFNAGVAKDFYEEMSNYDADLYKDFIVRATIKNPDNLTNKICINFILHEVK